MRQRGGDVILRTIGLVRAEVKLGLRNLAYNIGEILHFDGTKGIKWRNDGKNKKKISPHRDFFCHQIENHVKQE